MNIANNIQTSFGVMTSTQAETFFLEKGLVGFTELKHFFLIKSVFKQYPMFFLLQSIEDPSLFFILYKVEKANLDNFFEQNLLNHIMIDVGMDSSETSIALIVNIKLIDGVQKIFVNNKAPVLLCSKNCTARQYIISDKNYEIRRELVL